MNEWYESTYPCPVCGSPVFCRNDRIEGAVCEWDEECRGCKLWSSEFSYGGYREIVGFAVFEWSYVSEDNQLDERKAAREELPRAYRHPEFAPMQKAPLPVLADWFGDREFPIQEAALRAKLTSVES